MPRAARMGAMRAEKPGGRIAKGIPSIVYPSPFASERAVRTYIAASFVRSNQGCTSQGRLPSRLSPRARATSVSRGIARTAPGV